MHQNCPVCCEVKLLLCFPLYPVKQKCQEKGVLHLIEIGVTLIKLQYLFDTTKDVSVLACGHAMHFECAKQMEQHYR